MAYEYGRFYRRHTDRGNLIEYVQIRLAKAPILRPIGLLLEATPLIVVLELIVPPATSSSILSCTPLFASLAVFKTNLAHSSIVQFLSRHSHLESLTIDSCDSGSLVCPLHNAPLPSLTVLVCPESCIRGFSESININTLTLVYETTPTRRPNEQPLPRFTSVNALSISFHYSIRNPLRIALAIAPCIRILNLQEIPAVSLKKWSIFRLLTLHRTKVEPHRAWRFPRCWAYDLRQLHSVHELRLKTQSACCVLNHVKISDPIEWLVGTSLNRCIIWDGSDGPPGSIGLWNRVRRWTSNAPYCQRSRNNNKAAEIIQPTWERGSDEIAETYKGLFYHDFFFQLA
jgi:hypothetical protein